MINGTIFLLITVLGWGIMYPSFKIAVDSGIDGYYLATIRYVLGSMLLAGLLLLTESIKAFRYEGNFVKLWIYGTIGFAGLNIFTFVGISFSNAEHATIILALLPMMGIFLNWFLDGVRPPLHTLIFATISFIGIVLVITKLEFDGSLSESLLGDILLLIGYCVMGCIYLLYSSISTILSSACYGLKFHTRNYKYSIYYFHSNNAKYFYTSNY